MVVIFAVSVPCGPCWNASLSPPSNFHVIAMRRAREALTCAEQFLSGGYDIKQLALHSICVHAGLGGFFSSRHLVWSGTDTVVPPGPSWGPQRQLLNMEQEAKNVRDEKYQHAQIVSGTTRTRNDILASHHVWCVGNEIEYNVSESDNVLLRQPRIEPRRGVQYCNAGAVRPDSFFMQRVI